MQKHRKAKPLMCDRDGCYKRFRYRSSLCRHVKKAHGRDKNQSFTDENKSSKPHTTANNQRIGCKGEPKFYKILDKKDHIFKITKVIKKPVKNLI